MFDTRLIYQVVDWERQLEIENEKRGKPRRETIEGFTNGPEPFRQEHEPILARVLRLGRNRGIANCSVDPACPVESTICCESSTH